jgi:hypothetical protein
MEYAPMFAEIIKAHGGHVVLYETTPNTQNANPLTSPPTNRTSVVEKTMSIIRLAKKLDATVIPMALVAFHCQTDRPDFTLRYVDDIHPSQTMGYLTICTFYGALMGKSPEGLPLDRVNDPNYTPSLKIFSDTDRLDLQRIAWKALNEYKDFVTSREEIPESSSTLVYPNPTDGFIKIRLTSIDGSLPHKLKIIASDGKTVYAENIVAGNSGEDFIFDISGLPSSLYFLKLETSKGFAVGKFVLKN